MGNLVRSPIVILLSILLFNILIVSATLLLHETGHYLTGVWSDCKNIKLVLIDSEYGTYTEMVCPQQQSIYFPIAGALLLTTPFAILFLFLKEFPERNFIWISLGFNFMIAMADIPAILALQIFSFVLGVSLIVFGEVLLIDRILSYLIVKEV